MPDWHLDFSSGFRFPPGAFFAKVKPAPEPGVDIKVPWELSRFTFGPQLALATLTSGDDRYARRAIDLMLDWIAKNPWKRGVNWACAMDVALRACNWLLTIDLLGERFEALATPAERAAIASSLYLHGHHVFRNLERSPTLTSNHYISDLLGLLYVGTYLTGDRRLSRWRSFAAAELEREIVKQVYDDGADFEASTCYHRLALEIFFYAALLGRRSGRPFSDAYHERLRAMFRFVAGIVKQDGTVPQIGDNDSGRVHALVPRDVLDMRYLLSLGGVFFGDPALKFEGFELEPEASVFFTAEEIDRWNDLPAAGRFESAAFRDAGLFVIRNERDYLAVSCGPNGQNGHGGHAHNDKLSFHLAVDGLDFIVDPGTGVYTSYPDVRNAFRSTASHNTVMVSGEEQNRFHAWGVFSLEDDARAACEHWSADAKGARFVGRHEGYLRLPERVAHRRAIEYRTGERSWLVADELTGSGTALLEWFFVLHPEVVVSCAGQRATLERGGVRLVVENASGEPFEVREARYSPEYGVIVPTKKLVLALRLPLPAERRFAIRVL